LEERKWYSYLFVAEKRFSLLLMAVLFSLPFGWQAVTNSLLLVFLVHSIVGAFRANWKQTFKSPLFITSALFFLVYLLSLTWSSNVDEGLFQIETKLTFFFAPLLIFAGTTPYVISQKNNFLKALLFGTLAVSISALLYAAYLSYTTGSFYYTLGDQNEYTIYYFTYETLSKPFMHPGYLSTYMGVAVFICIYFLVLAKGKARFAYGLLLFFFFVMMILLQGRINILAMLAVLAMGALFLAIKQKAFVWLSVPLVPIVLLLVFMLFGSGNIKKRYFQLPDFSYDISGDTFNSATYRLAEWSCAVDVIKEYPLLGTGAGQNREALFNAYEKRGFWKGLAQGFNCHNQYVETTLATGFLGLFFLLLMLIVYGKIAIQNKDWLSLSTLLFFAMSMLTESMFERAWAVLLFTFYFPLMLFSGTKSNA